MLGGAPLWVHILYIKDRAQAAVTYITQYGNTMLWSLENLVPTHKLTQHLQIIFGRTDAVRETIDKAIEHDDEIRIKKCMRYLKPPKRFPVQKDMGNEETAAWINWIPLQTQALLDDLNEEIRLQKEADDPFAKDIVYAPINSIQESREVLTSQESVKRKKFSGKIPLHRHKQHTEEKLASPLPIERRSNLLPQGISNRHTNRWKEDTSEIPPINKEIRSKPPVYTTRANGTRWQINSDNVNWDGNNTSYLQLPGGRQQTALEQHSINDTTDIRLCHRCRGEGHIRKYCSTNVYCEFCESYSYDTSVCRSDANFQRAHPMASSRRTSPAQTSRHPEWTQPPTGNNNTNKTRSQNY